MGPGADCPRGIQGPDGLDHWPCFGAATLCPPAVPTAMHIAFAQSRRAARWASAAPSFPPSPPRPPAPSVRPLTPPRPRRPSPVRPAPTRPPSLTASPPLQNSVMITALLAKFTQNEACRSQLLNTHGKVLMEYSEKDKYWGDAGDFRGSNYLGKALMILRDHLMARGPEYVWDGDGGEAEIAALVARTWPQARGAEAQGR